MLSGVAGVRVPQIAEGREHVWHLYVIRHEQRDRLSQHLQSNGIATVINYPVALPFLPAYRRFGHLPEHFPQAHANQSRILSIPIFPEMSQEQISQVVESIASFQSG
jgi:dTDP-4-amino-4,6-dideoxygalactose transaminase